MSKVCMAGVNDNDRTFTLGRLRERFPEIPDGVISKILAKHAHNMEKCLTILSQESEKYLYGESMDSPGSKNSNFMTEPLSIDIPSNDAAHSRGHESFPVVPQTTMTVAIPTSSGTTISSGHPRERHHSADDYNDYNQRVIQHQRQRLDRLRVEYEDDKLKLSRLRTLVMEKEEELMNKNFRVAGNPSKTHVDHLVEETQVLRTEIDQMTQIIDNINNGGIAIGPHPPWLPTTEENLNNQSPVHDPSLEGWELLPKELISAPILTKPKEPPPPPENTEQTWQCKYCTLENHGALNVCEACEMPRH